MSKKPITTQGTFCDAPGCDDQVVEHGQRHCVVPADFSIIIFKKGNKERITVPAVPAGDYCSLGCLLETLKKSISGSQRVDPMLPLSDGNSSADTAPPASGAQQAAASGKPGFFKK